MKPIYVKKNGEVNKISGIVNPSSYSADDITYDGSTSGLTADDVQEAIDEIVDGLGTAASKNVGVSNGVAELDSSGKVPSSQLPSYVDDVIEVDDYSHLPITGESGKIYVTRDTSLEYRWSGTTYVQISKSLALGETSETAYRGDRGKTAYEHATETKLSTATASGLYKVAATAQGHIASLTAVQKSDITALGIPATDEKVKQSPTTNNNNYEILLSGSADNTEHTEGVKKSNRLTFNHAGGLGNGDGVSASGAYSHAEGYHTTSGGYSHSEGDATYTSDGCNHAEGYATSATSIYTHTEGYLTGASSTAAHAEGYNTIASGKYSHAEGVYTSAAGEGQLVIGKYNTPDTTSLFIIGNGSDTTARSNAMTVDATGNLSITKINGVTVGNSPKFTDTDTKVTSVGNHYTPTCSGTFSASASGATAAWSIDVVKGVTLQKDAAGHITGVSVVSGKIPANPNTDYRKSFYGTCDTAAGTAAKVVTLADTAGWELKAGTIVGVKFTNTNTASNVTLNVNGSGAKSIWYNNAAYTGSSNAVCGYAARMTYYMYDGSTYWMWLNYGVDANDNTYDRNRYTGTIKCGTTAIAKNNIIVGKDGVFAHLKSGGSFDINYPILYAASNIAASGTGNDNYDILAVNLQTTQSITLTAYKPVYIKGTLTGRMFTPVSTTPLTQTVPTAVDNYHYMLLGVAYSTTNIYLDVDHRIFAFHNDSFGEFTIHSKTVSQVVTNTDKWRKVLLGEQYEAEDTAAVEIQGRTLVTSIVQVQPSTNTLKATNLKAASNVTGTILGVSGSNNGGISLHNGTGNYGTYGLMFRKTEQFVKHGYVQGDWAMYFNMDGTANRGWMFRNASTGGGVASISNAGNMVLNGNVTIGGNAANTSGARMEYNSTNKCIDFVFV